jgi:hypothetical protein
MLWKKMASITALKLVPKVTPMERTAVIKVVAASCGQSTSDPALLGMRTGLPMTGFWQ